MVRPSNIDAAMVKHLAEEVSGLVDDVSTGTRTLCCPDRYRDPSPRDPASNVGTDMKPSPDGRGGESEEAAEPASTSCSAGTPAGKSKAIRLLMEGLLDEVDYMDPKPIVERITAIELKTAEDLHVVAKAMFARALAEPQSSGTYADMIVSLSSGCPEFPAVSNGQKDTTVRKLMVNLCQDEFENLTKSLEPRFIRLHEATQQELLQHPLKDLNTRTEERKERLLATVKFIGQLFLRELLTLTAIGKVVHDLIGIREGNPEECMIECTCVLLTDIGHRLDITSHGKMFLLQFANRLSDLQQREIVRRSEGGVTHIEPVRRYSDKVQCQIQELEGLRINGWKKKPPSPCFLCRSEEHFACDCPVSHELPVELIQLLPCSRCGCHSLCWCSSCSDAGCKRPVLREDFDAVVRVGIGGDTCDITARTCWSFKYFLRALAEAVQIPASHIRILHGDPLDVLDMHAFDELRLKASTEAVPVDLTLLQSEDAHSDADSDHSEFSHGSSDGYWQEQFDYRGGYLMDDFYDDVRDRSDSDYDDLAAA